MAKPAWYNYANWMTVEKRQTDRRVRRERSAGFDLAAAGQAKGRTGSGRRAESIVRALFRRLD